MPLQNRVTPFGAPISTEARGAWMGNRGCIHTKDRQIASGRVKKGTTRAWITCLLSFKERRRTVMKPGRYTELFFLDEATAFAAGHRPCWECRREDAQLFKRAWCEGAGRSERETRAPDMDRQLQNERSVRLEERPVLNLKHGTVDGIFILFPNDLASAFLVSGGFAWHWSVAGYGNKRALAGKVHLLTPPSIMAAFKNGYLPQTAPFKFL